MKRSKMIGEIKDLINLIRFEDCVNTAAGSGVITSDEYADVILDRLEILGMLPPFSHKVFEKNWNIDRDIGNCTGNEWDKENEQEK